uniref:Eukaryotic translation initiation factor 3 subunit E n=2 Tax=Lygus hesperus TaxID=30085 RepID=A0A0A9Z8K4_LYGHE
MIHIRPTRGLKGPTYVWRGLHQEGSRFHRSPERIDKMAFHRAANTRALLDGTHDARTSITGLRHAFFSSAVFVSNSTVLTNSAINKLKSELSKNRIHSSNPGDTVDNVPNNEIPISLVARILQVNTQVKSEKPETESTTPATKLESTSTIALRVEHTEPVISKASKVAVARTAAAVRDGRALVPYVSRSNTVLRTTPNVCHRTAQQLPKTAGLVDSNYKETYERLRKLGLLKSRMGNCHVGMTSPSGKTKFSTKNVKTTIENKVAKKVKSVPKKPAEINRKFLDNDVVLKVQHYYISQGKEVPEELKSLTRGASIRSSTSSNRFAELKRRRYQVYPCTSPSSTIFTRNIKRSE